MLKCDASGKKRKLLCCKHIFDGIKASLAEIQPKNHQNVQKTHYFFAKSSRSRWDKLPVKAENKNTTGCSMDALAEWNEN